MDETEKRILVVDDDAAIRALLCTILRRRGFAVDTARNGFEALEQLTRARYGLLIVDLMMPRMNGTELIDHLARNPVAAQPRVLVLTAGAEPRMAARDLVIGSVQKPFDIALLLEVVTACLNPFGTPRRDESCPAIEARPN